MPTNWRKSSFSGWEGECVETAVLDDGTIGVRDSKNPHGGTLVLTPAQFDDWLAGINAGEYDDLT